MYFLARASYVIIGSNLPQFSKLYGQTIETVGLLAFALERILTMNITGLVVEECFFQSVDPWHTFYRYFLSRYTFIRKRFY